MDVPSRVFQPDELENLDSFMMKYRKYGIVALLAEWQRRRGAAIEVDEDDVKRFTVFQSIIRTSLVNQK